MLELFRIFSFKYSLYKTPIRNSYQRLFIIKIIVIIIMLQFVPRQARRFLQGLVLSWEERSEVPSFQPLSSLNINNNEVINNILNKIIFIENTKKSCCNKINIVSQYICKTTQFIIFYQRSSFSKDRNNNNELIRCYRDLCLE